MQLIETRTELAEWHKKIGSKSLGFVPTMGALHEGHLSLIKSASTQNEKTICSIFVNPTQFNDANDLEKYPRTLQQDIQMLYEANCDAVFIPKVQEIYPKEGIFTPKFELDQLTSVLEGAYRPGHFDGVVQVVHRLLDLVRPDRLYMGLKDFQQQAIIAEMLRQMKSKTTLIPCPIKRAPNGLAMSSRNRRLSSAQAQIAPVIYQTLLAAKAEWKNNNNLFEIKKNAIEKLEKNNFKVDYFEIVDAKTLETVKMLDKSVSTIACVAAYLGEIRLIDNIMF